ncbi:CUB and zona pellucida-like domain-containing protein 1 [Diadema antillarum]|uniref:CUB and zona pellucida-like domain-containing protein 1 n=1 Tax=Diadema antillarum TaxID=105358 RepID=UPI003A883102
MGRLSLFWVIGISWALLGFAADQPSGEHGVDLSCGGDSMMITLDLPLLMTEPAAISTSIHVHLIDDSCQAENNGVGVVAIATTYKKCGTQKKVKDTSIVYSNKVYIVASDGEEELEILVQCEISRRDLTVGISSSQSQLSSSSLTADGDSSDSSTDTDITFVGQGAFSVSMQRFKTDDFRDVYPTGDTSNTMSLGDELFFEVKLENLIDLRLNLESCWATTSSDPYSLPSYEFIYKGCAVDNTVLFYSGLLPTQQRFSFQSFAFIGYNAEVYIHCKAFICDVSDSTEDCLPSCSHASDGASRLSRRRRESSDEAIITRNLRQYKLHLKNMD